MALLHNQHNVPAAEARRYVALIDMTKYIFLSCLLTSSILLLCAVAYAEDDSLCQMAESRNIRFSSHEADDTFSVNISGEPCQKAILRITVSNVAGDLLYEYEAPFKQHVVVHPLKPSLYEAAFDFLKTALESANWGNSSALPQWKPESQFYDENSTSLAVPKVTYQSFRERDLPVLWHQTYYEGWRHIVYDRMSKKAVILLDGGL